PRAMAPRSNPMPEWFGATIALADERSPEDEVKDLLEQYRRAMESRELKTLAFLYAEFPPEQQAAQQKYFDTVRDLRIAIDHIDIAVVGDEAVASYTRTDDFVDIRSGREMHLAVRLTKTLLKQAGAWKLAGSK